MKVLIILIIAIFFIWFFPNTHEHFSEDKVPKIIWAYWDNDDIPELVRMCQKNWKKYAPNYEIRFVNKKEAKELVDLPDYWDDLKPYRQSDVFRLKVLEKYGGVWIDASTFLLTNPDDYVSKNDITLFTTPASKPENPIFENWFIGSPPNHPIIKEWSNEVLKALDDQDTYVEQSPEYNKKAVENTSYLICHLALKNIYEKDKSKFNNAKIYDCNETAFYEHKKNNWDNAGAKIFKNNFKIDPKRLILKLRGSDRRSLDINDVPSELY